MIVVEHTIVSDDIANVCFVCDLKQCKGACCVEGDAGAPIEAEEISFIEDNIDSIIPFMKKDGVVVINRIGVFDYDSDGNYVTPLINDKECAFTIFENGIAKCAIEEAYNKGKSDFRKPISCFLYPLRITEHEDYEAVNYHKWSVCDCALKKGKKMKVPVYKFLKVPLIEKYGKEWYEKLEKEIDAGNLK